MRDFDGMSYEQIAAHATMLRHNRWVIEQEGGDVSAINAELEALDVSARKRPQKITGTGGNDIPAPKRTRRR
jgi:hypothetical protein